MQKESAKHEDKPSFFLENSVSVALNLNMGGTGLKFNPQKVDSKRDVIVQRAQDACDCEQQSRAHSHDPLEAQFGCIVYRRST